MKPPFPPRGSGSGKPGGKFGSGKPRPQGQGGPRREGGERDGQFRPKHGKPGGGKPHGRPQQHGKGGPTPRVQVEVKGRSDRYWLYGWHPVLAALGNNKRQFYRFFATADALEQLQSQKPELAAKAAKIGVVKATSQDISALLAQDVPHQGILLEAAPLPGEGLEAILDSKRTGPVLLLDQVTDPHNVGAILRSALAFGARGIITTDRHSAQEAGALAKAAAGALESMPLVRVPNLVNAMLALKSAGYWVLGLDGDATVTLHDAKPTDKTALVLGSEGKGLRRLSAERCDQLVKLPMSGEMESLNVSVAAAIALYECFRR
ncbi:23S rRNA (guanosine(2251)-2'-O)-methyltransferase RlmB [bacterium]|nr:23S rRNA (guanosine(2251)-2'-O)-methyltransferase RlmB [bacterium]